jgi:RND family efflux transporter MFP subunit
VAVGQGPINAFVSATGNVISRDELAINSPVSAHILELNTAEGEQVAKGAVLAHFDDRDDLLQVDKARASLALAKQNQVEARRDWERLQQIFIAGGEARKAVDDARLHWQAAVKDVRLAQYELHHAQLNLERLHIRAPADGIVTARLARAGAWTKQGDMLFKLAPSGMREIEVKLDAGDSAAATVGKSVTASSDAFPGREWREKITWVAPATNKEGAANTLNVRVSLGADAPPLVLGQQADVKISTASAENALIIPAAAVISRQGKSMVAVVANDSVHLVPIATGIEDLATTEVKSGVSAGQRIILPEGKTLREGDKVKLVEEQAAQ